MSIKIVKYQVVKTICVDDNVFNTNESILKFWNDILEIEKENSINPVIRVKGISIKSE